MNEIKRLFAVSCVLADHININEKTEMEVSPHLVIESVRMGSTAELSKLPSPIPKTESFPFSETLTKQGPLPADPKTSEENSTVKTLPKICWLPVVTGPCSKAKVLWYYNFLTGRCKRFSSR